MSLTNDYFLLYHGMTFEQNLDIEPLEVNASEELFTIYALIISASRKNFEKYLPLTSFKTLCQQIKVKSPSNINELNHLQYNVVESIIANKSKSNVATLHSSFEYLKMKTSSIMKIILNYYLFLIIKNWIFQKKRLCLQVIKLMMLLKNLRLKS